VWLRKFAIEVDVSLPDNLTHTLVDEDMLCNPVVQNGAVKCVPPKQDT